MRSPIIVKYNPDWRKRPSSSPAAPTGPTSPTPVEISTTEPERVQQITTVKEPLSTSKGSTLAVLNTATATTKSPTTSRAKMPITWDSHRKLAKKGVGPVAVPPSPLATNPQYPPTPETTPERKPSMFSRFGSKQKGKQTHYDTPGAPPTPTSPQIEDDEQVWKHHESYFPEYTPIYPTTTFNDPYAKAYLLTPAEIQAQQHAANVGHAVAVHYPMLPPFGDYSATKGQGAWQSGQWGNSNWTGFGLSGEKLPDSDGNTFGAPMPKGIPNPEPGAKGKGGGGGGEGGASKAEEGGSGGGGGGDASGGGVEGGAGGAGGGGGGGGGGKKGKGKK